jgi:hypothetical protein
MPRPWNAAEYLASYPDLQAAFGPDPAAAAAAWHWQAYGQAEGRTSSFDGLDYIAGYPDLVAALGASPTGGAMHWVIWGEDEGRRFDSFDGAQYLANYPDIRAAFGADQTAAAWHYILWGSQDGRSDDALVQPPPPPPPPPTPGRRIEGSVGFVNDVLVGGPGDDTLHGGYGADTLTGGAGADVFLYGTRLTATGLAIDMDSGTRGSGGSDVITDFVPGQDRIDLSALCTTASGDQFAAVWLGTAPFTSVGPHPRNADGSSGAPRDVPPEVRYEWRTDGTTRVLLDGPVKFESLKLGATPLDTIPDGEIILLGHHTLAAADFIL